MLENFDISTLAVIIPILTTIIAGIGDVILGIKNKDANAAVSAGIKVIESLKSLFDPKAETPSEEVKTAISTVSSDSWKMEEDTLRYVCNQLKGHVSSDVVRAAVKDMEARNYMEYGILCFNQKESGASIAAFISYGAVFMVGTASEVTALVNSRPQCGIISIAG